jgi:8-oxo-dGTP diphosphatase
VEPLAVRLGLDVEPTKVLAEGGDVDAALALVTGLDPDHGVACSHGDLIPHVLRRLVADGMEVEGPLLDQKGSVWVLDVAKGRVRRGRYVPPAPDVPRNRREPRTGSAGGRGEGLTQ